MSDERRRRSRTPLILEVYWEATTGKYYSRTSDLSTDGCFIDTVGQISVGEKVKFRLKLPSDEWIDLEGVTTYFHPTVGFGVRFTKMSEQAFAKLKDVVDTH